MSWPPPCDLGLPARYTTWRDGQVTAALTAIDAPTRFTGLVLPTGFGKSLVYMTILHLLQQRGVTLAATRALQAQLARDYADLPMAVVQGQRAYSCKALEPGGALAAQFADHLRRGTAVTVDAGPCHAGVTCDLKIAGCGYFDALHLAESPDTRITVANYAFWLAIAQRPQIIRLAPDLLILDEAHDAPDALSDAIGADLPADLCDQVLREALPAVASRSPEEWCSWAAARRKLLAARLEGTTPRTREALIALRRGQTLLIALERIAAIDPRLLVIRDLHDGHRFDVIWAAPYAEKWLFRGVRRILLTSATMSRHTADLLGIMEKDLTFYEAGDGFPLARRPVYIAPARRPPFGLPLAVDHRMSGEDDLAWLAHVDAIIAARPDRRGIVHSVSYKRRDLIVMHSAHRARMITHGRHDAQARIADFKSAGPGAVLVSPAVTTGYDFPFAECEYQILAKIPFPDGRDPVTKARTLIDPRYPAHVAMQTLVQTAGRGMRDAADQCENFIVDAHARWFLSKHADLAPRWFRRAVRRLEAGEIPPPPPVLSPLLSAGRC